MASVRDTVVDDERDHRIPGVVPPVVDVLATVAEPRSMALDSGAVVLSVRALVPCDP
jgi:hypothetical protein